MEQIHVVKKIFYRKDTGSCTGSWQGAEHDAKRLELPPGIGMIEVPLGTDYDGMRVNERGELAPMVYEEDSREAFFRKYPDGLALLEALNDPAKRAKLIADAAKVNPAQLRRE